MTVSLIRVTASAVAAAIFAFAPARGFPEPAPVPTAEAPAPSGEAPVSAPTSPDTAAPMSVTGSPTAASEPEAAAPKPAPETSPIFKAEQLDQLLAPIALYPDALLAQILMAATYPLDVVKADRWLQAPAHVGLQGQQLAAAIASEAWDPSIKSLVPFPRILRMMDQELDWTEQLGDAVTAQQGDVMDAIQRLRHQAAAAGTLWSNAEQRVTTERQGIVIEPANPEFIYPPLYSPAVYGPWPYPDYPPVDIVPADYDVGFPPLFGIGFGVGFAVVQPLWRWCAFDWGQRRIRLDVEKFNSLNHHGPGIATDTWAHNLGRRWPGPLDGDLASRARFRAGRGPVASTAAPPRIIAPATGASGPTPIPHPAPPAFAAAGPPPTTVRRSVAPRFASGGRELQARIMAQPGLVAPRIAAPPKMRAFSGPMSPRTGAGSTAWAPGTRSAR